MSNLILHEFTLLADPIGVLYKTVQLLFLHHLSDDLIEGLPGFA